MDEQQATRSVDPKSVSPTAPIDVHEETPAEIFSPDEKSSPYINPISTVPNFWNEGSFKKITKRIDDGARVLEDLSKIIHERAEIENLYATKLKAWEKKWTETLQKSGEYGSAVTGVTKVLEEGHVISDLHFSVHGKLDKLAKETLQWKHQRYPKSLTKYKEMRRSEEAFSKAQGPWLSRSKEAQKCMKAYHSAKDLLRSLKEQDEELRSQKSETTQEQLNKVAAKIKKCELEVENNNNKYHNALRDISTFNPKYLEDMKFEFTNCQNFEKVRREVMKEKLEQLVSCVDRRIFFENYNKVYNDTQLVVNHLDTDDDLIWYNQTFGPDHQFTPLEYIEYDPALHSAIINKPTSSPRPRPKSKSPNSSVCTTL